MVTTHQLVKVERKKLFLLVISAQSIKVKHNGLDNLVKIYWMSSQRRATLRASS